MGGSRGRAVASRVNAATVDGPSRRRRGRRTDPCGFGRIRHPGTTGVRTRRRTRRGCEGWGAGRVGVTASGPSQRLVARGRGRTPARPRRRPRGRCSTARGRGRHRAPDARSVRSPCRCRTRSRRPPPRCRTRPRRPPRPTRPPRRPRRRPRPAPRRAAPPPRPGARRTTTTTVGASAARRRSTTKQASGPTRPGATTGPSRRTSISARRPDRAPVPRAVSRRARRAERRDRRARHRRLGAGRLAPDRLRSDFAASAADPCRGAVTASTARRSPGSCSPGRPRWCSGSRSATPPANAGRRPRSSAPGALRLGRDESEAGVREQLQLMLASGAFTATGSDCRSLQLLVQAAAHEGLEVRDPRGFIVGPRTGSCRPTASSPTASACRCGGRSRSGRRRSRSPTATGTCSTRTGPDREGRLLAFTPGTEMVLWSGDCL